MLLFLYLPAKTTAWSITFGRQADRYGYNPLYSAIALAPDGDHDGRLEVHEVYGLDLAQTDLVVLSACQSQLGDLSAGDELVGLTRAFFFAGTSTVIALLWSVDDEATALEQAEGQVVE